MRDAIEDRDIVVAHVGRAVGPGFEIRRGGQKGQVQPVSFAQPAAGGDGLQALLIAHGDPAQHLPIEEGTEGADPGVVAEGGVRLADIHHVGFGNAYVERPALVHRRHAGLQAAGGAQVRIDRNHAGVPRKHLHRGGDDGAGAVLLALVDAAAARWRRSGFSCRAAGRAGPARSDDRA